VFPDRTAENLASYLDSENNAGRSKSYHRICDDDSIVIYVPDEQAAWAMPNGGNLPALQLCFTGWAKWDRAEWLAHKGMLTRGAAEVARWCQVFGIPARKLTPAEVAAGKSGVIGHVDWTNSMPGKRGNHTDPGTGFPWPEFMALVAERLRGEDMNDEQNGVLHDIRMQLCGSPELNKFPGWPERADPTSKAKTLVDYIRALHFEQQIQRAKLDAVLARLESKP
jgi:hypothetical protein